MQIKNNVISFVLKNVQENPEKIAFIFSKNGEYQKINNKDFFEQVLKFANVLKNKGIKRGDRIIVFLPISVELYIILTAMQVVGATPVFLES
jgi:acetyl-CoA synthetase